MEAPPTAYLTAVEGGPEARDLGSALSAKTLDLAVKRIQDVVVAGLGLVVLSPILLVVALAIRLESRGPAFYRCLRIGFRGREFPMLKFRKMHHGAGGAPLRDVDDHRHTRLGRFLSGTRLDEIPQLWNVLKGDMSLVGPRPEDPAFVRLEQDAFEEILKVRPGITGLSQLAFAREAEILDPEDRMGHYTRRILPQKLEMDRLYADRRTTWMDIKILAWTVAAVLLRRDVAVHRATGAMSMRRRPESEAADRVLAANGHANGNGLTQRSGKLAAANGVALANGNGSGVAHLNGNGQGKLVVNGSNGDAPAARVDGKPRVNGHRALRHVQVVILAGGRGTRLAPYTSILPKPLMPVGDRSILETVIDQLAGFGVRRVNLCVGYLSHLIRTVFDHRHIEDVEITYTQEQDALGTAAPLRLVNGLDETFIVMNGDVLTTLDYEDLLRHHRESGNALTIATHDRKIKIDYGMLHLNDDDRVREYEEKPEIVSPVSMGIYVLEPSALEHIPPEGFFDFPDLVQELLRVGERVGAYRYAGLWFDIGRHSDYEAAVAAWSAEAT